MCANLQHGSYAHVEPAAHRASCHASCLGAVKHLFSSHIYYLSHTFFTSNCTLHSHFEPHTNLALLYCIECEMSVLCCEGISAKLSKCNQGLLMPVHAKESA